MSDDEANYEELARLLEEETQMREAAEEDLRQANERIEDLKLYFLAATPVLRHPLYERVEDVKERLAAQQVLGMVNAAATAAAADWGGGAAAAAAVAVSAPPASDAAAMAAGGAGWSPSTSMGGTPAGSDPASTREQRAATLPS